MTRHRFEFLNELEGELARVVSEHERTPRPRSVRHLARPPLRAVAVGAAILALAVSASLPASPVRAAIDDVTSVFSPWASGDDDKAPGAPTQAGDNAPTWVQSADGRLIAREGDVALYVTRRQSDQGPILGFSLGGSASGPEPAIAGFDTLEGWRRKFDDHAVVVLGALPPRTGDPVHFPLIGVTSRTVDRVRVEYSTGPPLVKTHVEGGFVLLADKRRHIQQLAALEGDRVLERVDVSGFTS